MWDSEICLQPHLLFTSVERLGEGGSDLWFQYALPSVPPFENSPPET